MDKRLTPTEILIKTSLLSQGVKYHHNQSMRLGSLQRCCHQNQGEHLDRWNRKDPDSPQYTTLYKVCTKLFAQLVLLWCYLSPKCWQGQACQLLPPSDLSTGSTDFRSCHKCQNNTFPICHVSDIIQISSC